MQALFCILMISWLSLGLASQLRAQGLTTEVPKEYEFTTLHVPDSFLTAAHAINNSREIVGEYHVANGRNFGFLLSGGVYTTIDVPGSSLTWPRGINDRGEIVGVYAGPGGFGFHGFLLSGGQFTTLDVPGASFTEAFGINNSGQIVGFYHAGGKSYGFLLSEGVYTTIDVPGSISTAATGINDAGEIVGTFMDASGDKAFFLSGGAFTVLDVPGIAQAFAINSSGEIVGHYSTVHPRLHGFLLSGDDLKTIDVPNATSTTVFGINDAGYVVGTFDDGARRGFLAVPQEIDNEPPNVRVAAKPEHLWPPNGKLVAVRISGRVTDVGSGVNPNAVTYAVTDEYGKIQPSGTISLGPDGSFAFSVKLEASRDGRDKNGRQYTIVVSALDNLGAVSSASLVVSVPHHTSPTVHEARP